MTKRKIANNLLCATMVILTIVLGVLIFFPNEESMAQSVVLKRGSTGAQVKTLQTKLNKWGYNAGTVDGIFGKNTYYAVRRFQQKNGLQVDGIVGKATANALGMTLSGSTSSSGGSGGGSASNSDLYLLARCVYAESRGEPYTGQVAVAAVVLNRVKSSKFPNTIAGVIYEPYAFTAVADGQINLTPNEQSMNAARDAMNGWDPTNGCIYYFNPATATSAWIWSRPVKLVIGRHKFCM